MSKSDNAASIAAVAASIQTIGQARVALGTVSDLLRQAYEKVPSIGGADEPLTSNTLGVIASGEVRDAARQRIDVVNAYAGGIYATLPADEASQGLQLDTQQARRVGLALSQAQEALKDIEEAAGVDYWDVSQLLSDSIATVAGWTGGGLQAVTNAVAAGGAAFVQSAWPVLLAVGGGVALWVWWRFGRAAA